MYYLKFLRQLFESGRVVIESSKLASKSAISESESLLEDFERQWRTQLASDAPTLDVAAASWAGQNFYRACQLLMHRSLTESDALIGFPKAAFETDIPRTHYNVDLVFRFLPDLGKFAKALDRTDPLSRRISDWCVQWPLSSVGTANLDDKLVVDIGGFANDPSLLQLYVDRIIRHIDLTRVDHEQVRKSIESSIGEHPELARRFRTERFRKATSNGK